jgi:DNA repair photolyase
MKPIYEPKGAAKEYGDLALNIYTGCPHRCYYCFAPSVLRRDREKFHSDVRPRENIVEETRRQLEREGITGKLIHLCFTCDPYPTGYDTTSTREIIKLLKAYGNYVQILTKGDGSRDFDLLDGNDWYGITISGGMTDDVEPGAMMTPFRLLRLRNAHDLGIKTWVSFEPVIDANNVLGIIRDFAGVFDKVKIGKLNYHPSNIDWKAFGVEAEALCRKLGLDYTIKESLRREMAKP